MIKVRVKDDESKLTVTGRGDDVLLEGLVAVAAIAKCFAEADEALYDAFRDAMRDEGFWEAVNKRSKESESDGR